MTFQAAKCPECGADIQVPADRDSIKCMYCGKDIIVRQAVQAVAGPSAQNWMKLAAAAEDAGNHEEAYRYFTRVLEVEPGNAEAWLGKAIAAGWGSNLRSDRLGEMLSGIEQAIACAPQADLASLKARAAASATTVVLAFYKLSLDHTLEFVTVDSAWPEHVDRCLAMVAAMKKAIEWSPSTRELLDAGLTIVDGLLTGVEYARGEFKDGFAYLRLPADVRQRMETERADLVAKIKAIDPKYVEKKVKPVGGPGCGCIALVVLAAVVVLFAIIAALGWLSRSGQSKPAWSPPPEQSPAATTTATATPTVVPAPSASSVSSSKPASPPKARPAGPHTVRTRCPNGKTAQPSKGGCWCDTSGPMDTWTQAPFPPGCFGWPKAEGSECIFQCP